MGRIISSNTTPASFMPLLARKKDNNKICVICGDRFAPSGKNTKACKKEECQKELKSRTQKKYRELRESGKWERKIRKRTYKEKLCVRCGKKFIPKTGNQKKCCRMSISI